MIVVFNTLESAQKAQQQVVNIGAFLFSAIGDHVESESGVVMSDLSQFNYDSEYNCIYNAVAVTPVLYGKKSGSIDRVNKTTRWSEVAESPENTFYFTSPRGFMNAVSVILPNGKSVADALDEILPDDQEFPDEWRRDDIV